MNIAGIPDVNQKSSCTGYSFSFPIIWQGNTKKGAILSYNSFSVGVLRLERRTLCSQSRCANQLRHTPNTFKNLLYFVVKRMQRYEYFFILQKKNAIFYIKISFFTDFTFFYQLPQALYWPFWRFLSCLWSRKLLLECLSPDINIPWAIYPP